MVLLNTVKQLQNVVSEALILLELKSYTRSYFRGMTFLMNPMNPISDTAYSKLLPVDIISRIYTYKNAILLLV